MFPRKRRDAIVGKEMKMMDGGFAMALAGEERMEKRKTTKKESSSETRKTFRGHFQLGPRGGRLPNATETDQSKPA